MTAIVILGMHRSGTSALAGALESMGAHIGEANPNVKEQGTLVSINEHILKENGCTWKKPGDVRGFPEKQLNDARIFLENLSRRSRYYVIKDPRLVITIEQWIGSGVLEEYKLIATFRNPVSVAKSLNKRNPVRWSIDKGIDLWCEYNKRLLTLIKKYGCPLINFDQSLESYVDTLKKILNQYEIKLPNEQTYLDQGRVHWRFEKACLYKHPRARQIYSELKAVSFDGGL